MQNPSPIHAQQADHVICYLRDTKNLSIQYCGYADSEVTTKARHFPEKVFEASSGAAYGDDLETRRSSEGYVFKLYGGPIDWRAIRQPTVTTLPSKPSYSLLLTLPKKSTGGADSLHSKDLILDTSSPYTATIYKLSVW